MAEFGLWVFGDAHVGTDLRHGRESLAEAIRQSERGAGIAPAFGWDIALDVGDMSGGQAVPGDDEGREVVRQFSALAEHPREAIYSLCGNHDRSGLHEPPAWWWRKWVDPTGGNTAHSGVHASRHPYPVEGTWERYAWRVGNILFLAMSDINEPSQTVVPMRRPSRGTWQTTPAPSTCGSADTPTPTRTLPTAARPTSRPSGASTSSTAGP